jgi:hypothetical protein
MAIYSPIERELSKKSKGSVKQRIEKITKRHHDGDARASGIQQVAAPVWASRCRSWLRPVQRSAQIIERGHSGLPATAQHPAVRRRRVGEEDTHYWREDTHYCVGPSWSGHTAYSTWVSPMANGGQMNPYPLSASCRLLDLPRTLAVRLVYQHHGPPHDPLVSGLGFA